MESRDIRRFTKEEDIPFPWRVEAYFLFYDAIGCEIPKERYDFYGKYKYNTKEMEEHIDEVLPAFLKSLEDAKTKLELLNENKNYD